MKQVSLFDNIFVDNFAGGGGASTGIELATGRPIDVAINHDDCPPEPFVEMSVLHQAMVS